jgi:hypothetical protein
MFFFGLLGADFLGKALLICRVVTERPWISAILSAPSQREKC